MIILPAICQPIESDLRDVAKLLHRKALFLLEQRRLQLRHMLRRKPVTYRVGGSVERGQIEDVILIFSFYDADGNECVLCLDGEIDPRTTVFPMSGTLGAANARAKTETDETHLFFSLLQMDSIVKIEVIFHTETDTFWELLAL